MNLARPDVHRLGGFQVMSLGVGFKKVLAMDHDRARRRGHRGGLHAAAQVDDDGVTFTSYLNGDTHRFTPEVSMRIQPTSWAPTSCSRSDELTTLMNTATTRNAPSSARTLGRTVPAEHGRLTQERSHRPYQALFGVVQGAQYEDLRRQAATGLASLEVDGHRFDGYGIGGALEKENLGTIVGWVSESLPEDKPRHLLGISEPMTCSPASPRARTRSTA